jgi:hypothetical protein
MNSSISASEPRRWRRLLALYLASVLALGGITAALILALDPYDTGRFSLFAEVGVPNFGPRLTAASRAREKEMDAAIIGNSTIQLIDPARLSAESGRYVISLTIPGTGPREQLVVAGFFMRHHATGMRGLVFGIDVTTWCRASGRLDLLNPFPFWLYSADVGAYAGNMMRLASISAGWRKLKLLIGKEQPLRSDGYDDYEAGRVWDAMTARQHLSQSASDAAVLDLDAAPDDIIAAPLLAEFLARLPHDLPVVLVIPPRYYEPDVAPNVRVVARQKGCSDAFRKVARSRPNTALLDFVAQRDIAGPDEFWDPIHYRASVARRMEAAIAAALREGE